MVSLRSRSPVFSPARGAFALVAACILAGPIAWLQNERAAHFRSEGFGENGSNILAVTRTLPAFGNQNLFADLLWLRFAQYYGDYKLRAKKGYNLSYDYLEAITNFNPTFDKPYSMTNMAVAYSMGRTDLAEKLFVKGIQHEPNDVNLWQNRAFLNFLYTGDQKKAAQYFRVAAQNAVVIQPVEGQTFANHWLLMARYLEVFPPNPWTVRSIWIEIYKGGADDRARQLAKENLLRLGVEVKPDGHFYTRHPAYPPKGYAKYFVYGPPAPSPNRH